jgi:hypothetical protein
MSQTLIFSSEIIVSEAHERQAWELWRSAAQQPPSGELERVCYRREAAPNHFLELIAINGLAAADLLIRKREAFARAIEPLMISDWSRQVLEHVETVKPQGGSLPRSRKLQVRYIEVPLSVKDEYLDWRSGTIFDCVREAPEVEAFTAYQTLLSARPGVLFFSGFDRDSELYMDRVFRTARYQQIVRDAGARFIAGGEAGLSTTIYVDR